MPVQDEPGTILVVDDEATFQHLVRTLLEGEGHRVVQASDGGAGALSLEPQPVAASLT